MLDDLDSAFEEDQPKKGRPLHRRQKKRGGGRSFIAFFMAIILLGALGGGVWYGYDKVSGFFNTPDYDGPGTGEVQVQVKSGASATDIGNALYNEDVVQSAAAFIDAARGNSRSKNIQPGFYKLRKQMKASDALDMLLDLKNKISNKVTIKEGRTSFEIYDLLSKATNVPVEDFKEAAKDPEALGVPDFWFKRSDNKKVTKSIEGFLYPETYDFDPGLTAEDILKEMVQHFLKVVEELDFVARVESERNITPYDALMVASLAEAEAGIPKDIPKVARVAYNRLYVATDQLGCKCLEMDVTLNYGFMAEGKSAKESKDLTVSELNDKSNPYNSNLNPGLPPTAINNPGKGGLQGAMEPADGPWYFFVAIDKDGNSAFAATDAEHEDNKQIAKQNGVL